MCQSIYFNSSVSRAYVNPESKQDNNKRFWCYLDLKRHKKVDTVHIRKTTAYLAQQIFSIAFSLCLCFFFIRWGQIKRRKKHVGPFA